MPFALHLWQTLRAAGVHLLQPDLRFPWLQGWEFMMRRSEVSFSAPWMEMEERLWSCRDAMLSRPRHAAIPAHHWREIQPARWQAMRCAAAALPAEGVEAEGGDSGGAGAVPVLRIIAANDPIIPLHLVDASLFAHLDDVRVMHTGGEGRGMARRGRAGRAGAWRGGA